MNQVAIYNQFPSVDELKNMQMIANSASKSGLYNKTTESILMILLAARELNVGPCMALNGGIWNIQGRVEISARLMSLLIRRAGHSFSCKGDDKFCTVFGKRADTGDSAEVTFTIEMAEKAGLLKNPAWKNFPEDMLFNRAISRLSRRLFSDVIGNAYVEGEIDNTKEPDPSTLALADAEIKEEVKAEDQIKSSIYSDFPEDQHEKLTEFLDKWAKAYNKELKDVYFDFYTIEGREILSKKFNQWLRESKKQEEE